MNPVPPFYLAKESEVPPVERRYFIGAAHRSHAITCFVLRHRWDRWISFIGQPGEHVTGRMRTCRRCGIDEAVEQYRAERHHA